MQEELIKEASVLSPLMGKTLEFSGVCGTAFMLDGVAYEAIEDPNDGYRSYLDSIIAATTRNLTFFSDPIAKVRIEDCGRGDLRGFRLVDESTGHEWLSVGTDQSDDYYPCFHFNYRPHPSPY